MQPADSGLLERKNDQIASCQSKGIPHQALDISKNPSLNVHACVAAAFLVCNSAWSSAGGAPHQAMVRVESSLFCMSTPSANRSTDHAAIKRHKPWFTIQHGRVICATDCADIPVKIKNNLSFVPRKAPEAAGVNRRLTNIEVRIMKARRLQKAKFTS